SPHYGGDAYWPVANTPGNWVFWALTYDGTQQTNNVSLFTGSTASSVAMVGTKSIGHDATTNPTGRIFNDGANFALSGDEANGFTTNGYVGLQDNIRVFQGLLSPSDLEAIRANDLTLPEPSGVLVFSLTCALTFQRRRRRSRRSRATHDRG